MRIATLMTIMAAPVALAACDSGQSITDMDNMPMADGQIADGEMPMSAGDMPMMEAEDMMRAASAQGTVTAIDPEAGTITIAHGPIPAIDWPSMTMQFETEEQLSAAVAVGDEISFEFRTGPEGSTVTSMTKK